MSVFVSRNLKAIGALLFCLSLLGCQSKFEIDPSKPIMVFTGGAQGHSNDPIKFPKPLTVLRVDYSILRADYFAVRYERVGLSEQFVLHQLIQKLPDGSWIMQGYNRKTNPKPDRNRLTPKNYVGIAFPLEETPPLTK